MILAWCRMEGFVIHFFLEGLCDEQEDIINLSRIITRCAVVDVIAKMTIPITLASTVQSMKCLATIEHLVAYATLGWDDTIWLPAWNIFDEFDFRVAPWAINDLARLFSEGRATKSQSWRVTPDFEFAWDDVTIEHFRDEYFKLACSSFEKAQACRTGSGVPPRLVMPGTGNNQKPYQFTCTSTGDVYPWLDLAHVHGAEAFKLMNLFSGIRYEKTMSLTELTMSDRLPCRECHLLEICEARSPGTVYVLTGSLSFPTSTTCRCFQATITAYLNALEDRMNKHSDADASCLITMASD